jgi:hypothetical protein
MIEIASEELSNDWIRIYTEADAEEDAEIFAREGLQFNDFCFVDKVADLSVLSSENERKELEMLTAVDQHYENSRLIHFAKDVINIEVCFLEEENWELIRPVEVCSTLTDGTTNNNISFWPKRIRLCDYIQDNFSSPSFSEFVSNHSEESCIKQIRKDVERDRLLLNGQLLFGSSSTLDGITHSIHSVFDKLMKETGLPLLSQNVKERLTYSVLYKACRTNSAGSVLTVLQSLIDLQHLLLIPQANLTPPMKVCLKLGAFSKSELNDVNEQIQGTSWGVVCQIQCESSYLVRAIQDFEELEKQTSLSSSIKGHELSGKLLSATFEDYVYFETKTYGNEISNIDRVIDDSRYAGHVIISLIESTKL